MEACVFCRIAQHQLPAELLSETDDLVAFKDLHPKAPVHVLIIPKQHIPKLSDLTESTAAILTKATMLANQLAKRLGIAEQGYRVVLNCGEQAGQSVWHLHLHLLGGRALAWPPG